MKGRFLDEVACGVHSGFPLCCVAWYCLVWRSAVRWTKATPPERAWVGAYRAAMERRNPLVESNEGPWGRIPCPVCLSLRRASDCRPCTPYCERTRHVRIQALRKAIERLELLHLSP